MATAVVDLNEIKKAVLESLHKKSCRPMELLVNLENNYPDNVIKEAVLSLLREDTIEMTVDQLLREKENDLELTRPSQEKVL